MATRAELPEAMLRGGVIYRTQGGGVSGCGFIRKPDARGAYRHRVLPAMVVVYVLRGGGWFEDWAGGRQRVGSGCLIEMPPGRPHGVVHDADGQWGEAFVSFDGGFAGVMASLGVIDPARPVLRPGVDLSLIERFEQILRLLRDGADRDMPHALARVHELLLAANDLDHAAREPDPHVALVEKACQVLSGELQRRMSLPDLAGRFDLSYERFRKVFRERTGLSPGQYRIRRRIDHARTLLAQRGASVKEIAYALGYKDPFTFSKQFKNVVGVSPERFRGMT
jgi:AraC-like DNA-binding protein/quercetin dioxygenase-like cupin family protein